MSISKQQFEEELQILQRRYPGTGDEVLRHQLNKKYYTRKRMQDLYPKIDRRGRPVGFRPPISEVRQGIIKYLECENKPVKAKEIRENAGYDVLMLLSNMAREGVIKRVSYGYYGSNKDLFSKSGRNNI